ncbi:hypothetical protein VTO42DRAFT_3774 [Malbranchea cinnamomea]
MASSYEEDVDNLAEEGPCEDRDTLKPGTYQLGLTTAYVNSWNPEDAFRELYQNWKDAILTSFDIHPRTFRPVLEESAHEIQVTLHHPLTEELLGYIRFNKRSGKLEITNFKAQLELQNLSLGGTTKTGDDRVAGTHGEGFKVAALVLLREQHAVQIFASSHIWTFGMSNSKNPTLFCRVRKPAGDTVSKARIEYGLKVAENVPREMEANIWEDVSFVVSKGRGGRAISTPTFREWLKVTLDIHTPAVEDVIQTDHGDLILDPRFKGRVFLKGLQLLQNRASGKQYQYSYNLISGRVNRDRESMADPEEEGRILTVIWSGAIAGRGDSIIPRYLDLFRDHPTSCDVRFAPQYLSQATAEAIWRYLKKVGTGRFYYNEQEGYAAADIVVKNLKMIAEPLPKTLWNIFKFFDLARSPSEELQVIFSRAQEGKVKDCVFSRGVRRGLEACLLFDSKTTFVRPKFVDLGQVAAEGHYDYTTGLIIHDKWIDFKRIHDQLPCSLSLSKAVAVGEAQVCIHVIEELFALSLSVILPRFGQLFYGPSGINTLMQTRHHARYLLEQMPQKVELSQTRYRGQLLVTWVDGESKAIPKKRTTKFYVILHCEATCMRLLNHLIAEVGPRTMLKPLAACGCRQMVTTEESALFDGLDENVNYFPLVSRAVRESFFGMPPPPIKPSSVGPYSGNSGANLGSEQGNMAAASTSGPKRDHESNTDNDVVMKDLDAALPADPHDMQPDPKRQRNE